MVSLQEYGVTMVSRTLELLHGWKPFVEKEGGHTSGEGLYRVFFKSYTKNSSLLYIEVFIMSVLSVFGAMLLPKLVLRGQMLSQVSNYTMASILITKTIYGSCIPFSSTFSIPNYSYLNRGGIATKYRSVGAQTVHRKTCLVLI